MLWNENLFFVEDALKNNFYEDEFIGWCDIGYFRDGPIENWPSHNKINNLDKDKIYYIKICDNSYYSYLKNIIENKNEKGLPSIPIPENQVSVAGGFFLSHKKNIKKYSEIYSQKLQNYFDNTYLIKDDQIIVIDSIISNPEYFKLIDGDWFEFRNFLNGEYINILMPIYNGVEFIEDSLNSIKSQTFKDWELIIGINGHPENSDVYKKAKSYENEKIKVLDMKTKGKVDTLNEMLKFSKSKWISLLDVDDIWIPNKLNEQIPFMKNYDIIGTKCIYFGDRDNIPYIPIGDLKDFNFLTSNPIINSSSLIRKELCFWKNDFFGIEDYELWLRLKSEKRKFFNVDKILVLHRIHNSSSFNSKGNENSVGKLIEKYKHLI
jgi:teichuronic acid biosynthesis glycosyltransferase TuaG